MHAVLASAAQEQIRPRPLASPKQGDGRPSQQGHPDAVMNWASDQAAVAGTGRGDRTAHRPSAMVRALLLAPPRSPEMDTAAPFHLSIFSDGGSLVTV